MKLVKGSRVFIPWSGGMDSTYLVYRAILAGCRVTTAYFKVENNTEKVKAELNARVPMIEYFRTLARDHNAEYDDLGVIFSVDVGAEHTRGTVGKFSQTPLWILASAYCAKDYDYVAMGFVQGDETVSWFKEYTRLFEGYKKIQADFVTPPKVKLIFPISRTRKDDIYWNLPDELRNKTWTCEAPTVINDEFHECGICKPCKTHLANTGRLNFPYVDRAEYLQTKDEPDLDNLESTLNLRAEINKQLRRLRKKSQDCLKVTVDCEASDGKVFKV